ncbi:glycosyltransferase family 2 protein [Flavobacterium sp.]|uniref:glycosyltransferase family 2 protein n=1 Tax=Flavobacterium sp. TaxID=239 RepID=UPI002B4ACBB6|nr:glycosyltransferase family 2 protein [Flavobacterium sp.]HLF51221.1 glycosyltransferase family 2 protein [Flavobacterium sp.]
MNNPLVSIIIPTYNRVSLIRETLDSVLAQTYTYWECIVVDDGSTDATEEVVQEFKKKDPRFQYYLRPVERPKGANTCRNYGLELSKGEFVQFLDSDDLISSNKIEVQIVQLLKDDAATIAICRWQFFSNFLGDSDSQNEFKAYKNFDTISEFIDALAWSGGFLPPHAYLVSRKLIDQAGNWMENLAVNQDGEFFARIFIKAKRVVFSNNAVVYYRRNNDDNVSLLNNELKITHAILSWQLIESYFKIHFGESTQLVRISKKYLYQRISKENEKIIKENKLFFEDEIRRNNFSFKRILYRIFNKN